MSKSTSPLLRLALCLSIIIASVNSLTVNEATSYLTRGLEPIFASAALASRSKHILQSRSTLQKRFEICSYYGYYYYYCNTPTHCVSDTTCSYNFLWIIIVAAVLLVLLVAYCCIRRRRNYNNNTTTSMVVTQVSPGGPDSTAVTYQPQQPAMGYVQQQPPQPLQPTPIYNTPPPLIGGHDPNYVQQVQFPGTYVTPGQEYQPVPTNVAPSPYMGSPYPVTVADPYQQPQRQPSPVAGYSEPYTPSQQYVQDQPTEFAGYHQQQPPGPLATPQPLYEQAPASIQTPYAYSPHSPQQFGHATYVPK